MATAKIQAYSTPMQWRFPMACLLLFLCCPISAWGQMPSSPEILPRSNNFSLSRAILRMADDPAHSVQTRQTLLSQAQQVAPAYWRPYAQLARSHLEQGHWQESYRLLQKAWQSIWHYGPHRGMVLATLDGLFLYLLASLSLVIAIFLFARYLPQLLEQYTNWLGFQAFSWQSAIWLLALLFVPVAFKIGVIGVSCFLLMLAAPWFQQQQTWLSSVLLLSLLVVPGRTYQMARQLEQTYGESALAWRAVVEQEDGQAISALADRAKSDRNQQIAWLFAQHQQQPSDATSQALLQLLPQFGAEQQAEIWFLLGNGYWQRHQIQLAQQAYEKALLQNPQHEPTLFHLSHLLVQQEKKHAADYFQRFQTLASQETLQWQQLQSKFKFPFVQADALGLLQPTSDGLGSYYVEPLARQLLQQFAGWLPPQGLYGVVLLTWIFLLSQRIPKLRIAKRLQCDRCGVTVEQVQHAFQPQCKDCYAYLHPKESTWTAFQRLQYELRQQRHQASQRWMAVVLYRCFPGVGHLYKSRYVKGVGLLSLFVLGYGLIWFTRQYHLLEKVLLPLPHQCGVIGLILLIVAYSWSWLDTLRMKGLSYGA